ITDPYVVHHGALGSYATIYALDEDVTKDIADVVSALPATELTLSRRDASARFSLAADRIGDIVVFARKNWVLGTSKTRHDLSMLKEPLRSHGGLSEQEVPFIINRKIRQPFTARPRNFDIFDAALNRLQRDDGHER